MGTSEHKHIGIARILREGLCQVDSGDLFGDRVLYPSLFDQRDQQGTSLLPDRDSLALQRPLISMTADGRLGADDDNFLLPGGGGGSFGPRLNDTDHSHMRGGFDL